MLLPLPSSVVLDLFDRLVVELLLLDEASAALLTSLSSSNSSRFLFVFESEYLKKQIDFNRLATFVGENVDE